jgi:hypothetical protein
MKPLKSIQYLPSSSPLGIPYQRLSNASRPYHKPSTQLWARCCPSRNAKTTTLEMEALPSRLIRRLNSKISSHMGNDHITSKRFTGHLVLQTNWPSNLASSEAKHLHRVQPIAGVLQRPKQKIFLTQRIIHINIDLPFISRPFPWALCSLFETLKKC